MKIFCFNAKKINFAKAIAYAIGVLVFVLFASQVRMYITKSSSPVSHSVDTKASFVLTITLDGKPKAPDAVVYVNGESFCAIGEEKTKVLVDSTSVIEIYCPEDTDLSAFLTAPEGVSIIGGGTKTKLLRGMNYIARVLIK